MPDVQSASNELTPLQKAHLARKKKIEDGTFQVVRMNPVEKGKAHPTSKALAIRAMCYHCVGGERAVDSIRNCTSGNSCPLYTVRPYQAGSQDEDDLVEIVDITDTSETTEIAAVSVISEISTDTQISEPDEADVHASRLESAVHIEQSYTDQERLMDALALQEAFDHWRAA